MWKRLSRVLVVVVIVTIPFIGFFWPHNPNLGQFKDVVSPYALGDTNFTLGEVSELIFDSIAFWQNDGTKEEQRETVIAYFDLIDERKALDLIIERREASGAAIARHAEVVASLDEQRDRVERIMESQIVWAIQETGIRIYTVMPPVEVQFHEDPTLLVISSRDQIDSVRRIRLIDNLSLAEKEALEAEIDAMGYSALIVDLGGQSTYPATVRPQGIRSTLETITHEWVHHYRNMKNLRSMTYDSESRAIEETIASLLDREISDLAYKNFYDPEYVRPEVNPSAPQDAFDDNAALRETYEQTVELLELGLIDEAEAYMNDRRDFLEENRLFIRKINQAYFAFSGSYASGTNSAFSGAHSGVGEKLTQIFEHLDDPTAFLKLVIHIDSVQQLDELLEELGLAD